jgi:hypothetical protein
MEIVFPQFVNFLGNFAGNQSYSLGIFKVVNFAVN